MKINRTLAAAAVAAVFAIPSFVGQVSAQPGPMGPGYGMGPGMMGDYGPGYGAGRGPNEGYGPGYGMGPGMMGGWGGYGMGPGMMGGWGGYGMGPGMMGGWGGYGMGPGMMGGWGGYGMGPGMMWGYGRGGGGGLGALNLTDAQRAKIADIQRDASRKQWDLMGKVHEQQYRLQEQYASGRLDDDAARKAYAAMADAHKQMFDIQLDARKKTDAVLTKEQRERLRDGTGWGAPHHRGRR